MFVVKKRLATARVIASGSRDWLLIAHSTGPTLPSQWIFFTYLYIYLWFLKNNCRNQKFSKVYHRWSSKIRLALATIANNSWYQSPFKTAVGAQDRWLARMPQQPLPMATEEVPTPVWSGVPTAVAKGGWTQPPLQMVVEAFFRFFWIFYVFGDFQLKN
jgi:hypothetical protein